MGKGVSFTSYYLLTMSQTNDLTEYQYRTHKAISNSDLGDLSNFLFPSGDHKIKAKPSTLYLGTLFHKIVLQPQLISPADYVGVSFENSDNLQGMYESLITYTDIMSLIHNGEKEVIKFWDHPQTRLPLKCKIDSLPDKTQQIDLKTTGCNTEAKFLQSIKDYHYERQAAFYMNHSPFQDEFTFVGVQKVKPYNVYIVTYKREDSEIVAAQKQINQLLKTAYIEFTKNDGWRPQSWSLTLEEFR